LIRRWRRRLVDFASGLGFTVYEQRALIILLALVLIGAAFRYQHNRDLARRFEVIRQHSDSLGLKGDEISLYNLEPLDLNTASGGELQRLPGIGPALAGRILEYRSKAGRFKYIDELLEVRGIGPVILKRLKPLVRVAEADSTP
jgi:competence ComEA-like helix-hairpin-helix protein